MTGIEWTDRTWNPVTGCTKVSPGCDHCYAEGIARRFAGSKAFPNGFDVTLRPERLDAPLRWRKSARVFVNSMSDLFHDQVPYKYIAEVFGVMAVASGPFSGPASPRRSLGTFRMYPDGPEREASLPVADYGPHTFQVLTKRHGRMRSLLNSQGFRVAVSCAAFRHACNRRTAGALADWIEHGPLWPLPNVWLGVSVEDQKRADLRIPALLDTPAAVRFLSCEPLIGPVDLLGRLDHGCNEVGPAITHDGYEVRTDYGTGIEHDCDHQIGIDWVIVGGESGAGARPMHLDWARALVEQCRSADVPVFVKQLGTAWARDTSVAGQPRYHVDPKGADWSVTGFPSDLRVRQWPEAVTA